MREADFTHQMEEECNNLVREKGPELLNVSMIMDFFLTLYVLKAHRSWLIYSALSQLLDACDLDLYVQEPFFSQLKSNCAFIFIIILYYNYNNII